MATRTTTPLGAPVWIDLATSDVAGAQAFYGTVMGWDYENPGPDYGGYINARRDGRYVGGMMAGDPAWNAPDAWTVYLHTADIQATIDAAVAAGATTCIPAMEAQLKLMRFGIPVITVETSRRAPLPRRVDTQIDIVTRVLGDLGMLEGGQ